jgi:hypothetical protein
VDIHLDQMFLKPPGTGAGTAYHQDNGYFRIRDPLKGLGMWIAIDDATVEGGTMHIVPRTHLKAEPLPHVRDGGAEQLITCEPALAERGAVGVPCELAAGGVVFFCYGAAHCTLANRSAAPRAGVAYHFLGSDYVVAPSSGAALKRLRGPGADGGRREYGESMLGRWGEAVGLSLQGDPGSGPAGPGRLAPREFAASMQVAMGDTAILAETDSNHRKIRV